MLTLNNKPKQKFNVLELLFWIILFGILPFYSGLITVFQFAKLGIYCCSSFFVGSLVLTNLTTLKSFPFFVNSAISILLGSLVLSFFSFFFNANILIYLLFAGFIAHSFFYKTLSLEFNFKNLLALVPLLLLFFNAEETAFATTKNFTLINRDYGYYTSVCQSLVDHFSIYDSFNFKGLPINYPTLPFQSVAQMCVFTGISTPIMCWGIFGKMVAVFAFTSVASFIVLFVHYLIHKTIESFTFNPLIFSLACILLLFFSPINFSYLAKLDFSHITFLGYGYLLPFGSLGFSLSIFFIGLLFIAAFLSTHKKEFFYVIPFIVFIGLSKYAALAPTGIFLGCVAVLKCLKKDYALFISLLVALPFVVVCYFIFNGSNPHFGKFIYQTPGIMVDESLAFANKYHIGGGMIKKTVVALSLGLIFWMGYKVVMIFMLQRNKINQQKFLINFICIGLIASLIISFIPSLFFNIVNCNENDNILWDSRQDTIQFARAAIFLFTIFSCVAFIFLSKAINSKKINLLFIGIITVWCSLHLFNFFSATLTAPIKNEQQLIWYNDVKKEFEQQKPRLMCMMGTLKCSGTILSSYGIGPWYCTGTTTSGDGYCMNLASYQRACIYQSLLDSCNNNYAKTAASSLKREAVDYIVFTTADSSKKSILLQNNIIVASNNKWVFKLK